jgi:hypothetical protein
VFGSGSSNSRLAKTWNWEFTLVNNQLQGERNEEVGLYREWPYLIKRFEVCYSPSFSLWMNQNNKPNVINGGKSLIAFAPIFDMQQAVKEI